MIFGDTLIRRTCHPEAVKLATAQHVFLRFYHTLKPDFSTHWHVYEKRTEIERHMAQRAEQAGHDGEYELIDVFQHWLESILVYPYPFSFHLEEVAKDVAENELRFEILHTFPDDDLMGFIKDYPAEKTFYLSDFYMSSSLLNRLLRHHGLQAFLPEGLVSCDVMLNKRSGRLFKHLHSIHGVTPDAHVHIGDNPFSDVEMPRQLGIKALHYLPQAGHQARISREALFSSRNTLFAHLMGLAQTQEDHPELKQNKDAKAAFELGLQAASLFTGFALFIAEQAIMDGVESLFFFTREGEFFARLFKVIFPDGVYNGHKLPPYSVLAVSRQATFSPSLKEVSLAEFNRIWALNWQQNLSTLFKILGVDPEDFEPLLADLSLSLEEMIVRPQDDQRIASLLDDPKFSSAVLTKRDEKQQLLKAYLQQEGILGKKKIGCVDIGWRGSIQDNLAHLIPECETVGYYLALRRFINVQPLNAVKRAFGPDQREGTYADFFETFEPLELLCNSPYGSVIDYRKENGHIAPVRETNSVENALIERFTQYFQDGVTHAAQCQRPLLISHAVMSSEMRDMALNIWKGISSNPVDQLVEAYYAAPQHDVFGYGDFFERDRVPSLTHIAMALLSKSKRHEVIQFIRRTQWRSALSGLKTGWFHKFILWILFSLAHQYKRWFILRRKN